MGPGIYQVKYSLNEKQPRTRAERTPRFMGTLLHTVSIFLLKVLVFSN